MTGLSLIEMNPPRGTRKNKKARRKGRRRSSRPSPAQLRARAAFAAMARAKAKSGGHKHTRTRRAKRRRVAVRGFATRRATTMPSTRKRRRSGRRGGRAGGIAHRAFTLVPFKKDMIPDVIGLVGGMVAVPKLVEKLGSSKDATGVVTTKKWLQGADGHLSPTKYMIAKLVAGGLLATVLGMAKQHRIARAVAVGTLANAAYDQIIRQVPTLAPGTLAGGVDDMGFLRELPPGYGMNDMGYLVPIAQAA